MTAINQRLGIVLIGCVLAIALACAVVLAADAPQTTGAPTLTSDQRTQLHLRVLIYRNAQLELEALIKDLAQPGYTIDLSQLTYVHTPEAKAVAP